MGARIVADGDHLDCAAPDGLHGAEIHLRFPSVGATETLLIAAAAAAGQTPDLRGGAGAGSRGSGAFFDRLRCPD